MNNIGLILEGGGMRGLFTAGVLDFFLDKNIDFPYVIGVSAGACNGASYIAKQKGRNLKVMVDYIQDSRYLSYRNLIRYKSIFGMDFVFKEIPNKLLPFDYEAFKNSEQKFYMGTTDCETGKALFFEKNECQTNDDIIEVLKASSSLAVLAPIVNYKGYKLLDGGLADSIPIKRSIEDGNTKNIVVLTRNKGYRKSKPKYEFIIKKKYSQYPNLVETLLNRYKVYNETLEFVEKLEDEGEILVIRPVKKLEVGRTEKNPDKLRALFHEGYEAASSLDSQIINFINF